LYRTIFFLCVFICNANAGQADISQKMRKHFEWGEYDSLFSITQAALARSAGASDSLFLADCHKYLGVVAMTRGNISEARSEFEKAYKYNPHVELDILYVSREIYQLFQVTFQEHQQALRQKAQSDSLLKVNDSALQTNSELRVSLKTERRRHINSLASIVSLGIMTLCGAVAIYEYVQADRTYRDFRNAAAQGDYLRYNQARDKVRQGDIISLAWGSGALISGATGIFFALTPLKPAHPADAAAQKNDLRISCGLKYEIAFKN
jgi:tetratricopeptide (TPR) repeat protein